MRTAIARVVQVERRRIASKDEIVFSSPLPPGTNNLFLNIAGKGRIKSRRYRDWIKEAGWSIQAARCGWIDGPVTVAITLPDKMRLDTDAAIKPLLDLCVRHHLIEDDAARIIRGLSVSLAPIDGAKVTIRRAA